ncbi:DUF7691 family protein [Thermomonospora catenispora]|uniref:DUF7691 family protein n=1 Tax=Thermomonospora catenispora TaxID=2493090 RepID=UPI00111CA1FA|nr:hypothetical protein [Thermomonospora catenispora]TNY38298.1 hypothetical protein EIO00_04640 [Thermomonospora catenispora]
MSYAIMSYAVRMESLEKVVGSGEERLFTTLVSRAEDELARLDEMMGDTLSARDALRHMIMGEEYDKEAGAVYGYCLKLLCEFLNDSTWLPNDYWSGMRFGWFDVVHGELKRAGVHFDPTDLIYGPIPFGLPSPDDFPNIGHTTLAEIPPLLEKFDAMDPEAVTDPDARGAIEQIHDWLRTCDEMKRDLICFYH